MGQKEIPMTELNYAPPTVHSSTSMKNGRRLHTIDPDEGRDIDVFDDDERPWSFANPDENRNA